MYICVTLISVFCIIPHVDCNEIVVCYVNVFVMRLCMCNGIQVQLKFLNECHLSSSVCELTVKFEWSNCSLVNCHIVYFFMWRCASASAARSRHKQYERSEMKLRMFIKITQCWPSGK